MARLNTRSSTVPTSRDQSSTASTDSPTRTPTQASDQENRDPVRPRDKGKGRAMERSIRRSLPTPSSDVTETARGQKRKRTEAQCSATQPDDIDEDIDLEDRRFTRYYDPNQNADTRREVKRKSRAIQRDFYENRNDYMRGDNAGLKETINRANQNFKQVKQTGDATVDARLLVDISTVAKKKTESMVLGDTSTGLDVDFFLSRCVSYMRNGGPSGGMPGATPTQTRRRRTRDAEDSEEDDDDTELDWETFGRIACFPYNSRPICPSFLLGPLSVEKKFRAQTQRRARQRMDKSQQVEPKKLEQDDMNANDQNGLTAICTNILEVLRRRVKVAIIAIQAALAEEEPLGLWTEERQLQICKEHRVDLNLGGPGLFEFVVNPDSFGQTIENIFYVSFLIKEGHVGIQKTADGMPVLIRKEAQKPRDGEIEPIRDKGVLRNQAVFSLDYATWEKLIEAFDITEPMIPHREEAQPTQVGSGGWYA